MAGGMKIADIYAELRVDSGKMEQGLAHARQALGAIAAEARQLKADLRAGAIGIAQYDERLKALNATAATLKTSMQAAYASIGPANGGLDVMAQGMSRASGSATNFGMALMHVGSIVDDAMYGFSGIVNNIGPLALAMSGGNMAIAGAAQIAAVAVYQLYDHWGQLMDALGMNANIKTASDEMKELADQTERTAEESARLNRLKREARAVEGQQTELSEEQKKSEQETRKVIAKQAQGQDTGGFVVAKQLREMLEAEGALGFEPKEEAAMRRHQGIIDEAERRGENAKAAKERLAAIKKTAMIRNQAEAEARLAQAETDPEKHKELVANIRRRPEFFGGFDKAMKLAKDLESTTPQAIAAGEAKKESDKAARAQEMARNKARHDVTRWLNRQVNAGAKWVHEQAKTSKEEFETNRRVDVQMSRDVAKNLEKNRGIRGQLLANPQADVSNDVRAAMTAMGYGKQLIERLLPQVMADVRKKVMGDIDAEVGARGGDRAAAGKRLAEKEESERRQKMEGAERRVRDAQERRDDLRETMRHKVLDRNRPQFMGLTEYAKKLAVGGFETDKFEREMLKLQRESVDAERDIKNAIENRDMVARAGR